jgi:hypothetical protein
MGLPPEINFLELLTGESGLVNTECHMFLFSSLAWNVVSE